MAGVADDQTQVVVPGKIDTGLDVRDSLGHDDQHGIVAQRAGVGGVRRRSAGVVGEVGPKTGGGQVDPGLNGEQGQDKILEGRGRRLTGIAHCTTQQSPCHIRPHCTS